MIANELLLMPIFNFADSLAPKVDAYRSPKHRDAPFNPACLPGCRLPHCNISLIQRGRLRDIEPMQSTIDLPRAAGLRYVLLCIIANHSQVDAWRDCLQGAFDNDLIVPVVLIPQKGSENNQLNISYALPDEYALATMQFGRDGPYSDLLHTTGGVGILTRPDGHIASLGSPSELSEALQKLL